MQISERAKNLGVENAFEVTAYVQKLKREGRTDIIDFLLGQPDFDTPENIKEAAIKAIKDGKTGYTASAGTPELREAAAKWIGDFRGMEINPEDVVVANGAKPFIGFSIYAAGDSGQGEVVIPLAGYPIYYGRTKDLGLKPVYISLRESKDFKKFVLDIDELKAKLNKNTRLLILNFPQNPVGAMLTKEELEEIANLVLKYDNLWVLSDEVYSHMVHHGKFISIASVKSGIFLHGKFISIASMPGMKERTIIMEGVSKAYAMTGWRIGFAANKMLAKKFIKALEKQICSVTSCPNHPAQWAALEAITGPQEESEKMMKIFAKRADLIYKLAKEIPGFNCVKPQGAFYLWANVTEACRIVGARDSEEFRKMLLDEIDVAVLADKHFDPRPQSKRQGEHIRFSYATSEENIIEGLERIKKYVEGRIIRPYVDRDC